MLIFLPVLLAGAAALPTQHLPPFAQQCLAAHPELTADRSQTPLYLKAYFTKSQQPDYAIAVLQAPQTSRMLVCMHDGSSMVLGSKGTNPPFSDMNGDDYISSDWRVCTKGDVIAMKKHYRDVPETVNQAICLTWEDGEAIIYWDGSRFRWKSFKP